MKPWNRWNGRGGPLVDEGVSYQTRQIMQYQLGKVCEYHVKPKTV